MTTRNWSSSSADDGLAQPRDALGAEPVDFHFALVSASVSGAPDGDAVHPDRWFVTGGD